MQGCLGLPIIDKVSLNQVMVTKRRLSRETVAMTGRSAAGSPEPRNPRAYFPPDAFVSIDFRRDCQPLPGR